MANTSAMSNTETHKKDVKPTLISFKDRIKLESTLSELRMRDEQLRLVVDFLEEHDEDGEIVNQLDLFNNYIVEGWLDNEVSCTMDNISYFLSHDVMLVSDIKHSTDFSTEEIEEYFGDPTAVLTAENGIFNIDEQIPKFDDLKNIIEENFDEELVSELFNEVSQIKTKFENELKETIADLHEKNINTESNREFTNEQNWMQELWAWADANDISEDDLPRDEVELTKLTELYLEDKNLTSLPESIGSLTNLTELWFSGNKLTSLPESIGNLTNLSTLNLQYSNLTKLPESIGNLTNLTELGLEENDLTSLPESIGSLTNLTELNLGGNHVSSLPESIGNLIKLKSIIMDFNKLTNLPENIGSLTNLIELNLEGNHVSSLPKSIGNLINLEKINISDNELPKSEVDKLKELLPNCDITS